MFLPMVAIWGSLSKILIFEVTNYKEGDDEFSNLKDNFEK